MAAFNADILLNVASTKAEKAIKKVENNLTRVAKKASSIDVKFDVDEREIRRADRLLNNLARNRIVKVRIDEQVRRSGGGGSSSNASSSAVSAAALLPGLAAGATASAGINKASKELKEAARALTPLESATEKVVENIQRSTVAAGRFKEGLQQSKDTSRKLALINEEIERTYSSINDKTNQFKAQMGNVKRIDELRRMITKDEKIAREDSVVKAKELFKELKKAVKEQDKLADKAAEYNKRATQVSGRFQAPGLPPAPPSGGALPPSGGRGGRRGNAFGGAAAGGALAGLRGNIATTIASLVGLNEAIQETGRIISATLDRTSSNQRLEALSNGFDSYASTLDVATRAAERFNLSQTDAQQQIAQVYGRLRPLGLTLEEIESTFVGFSTAARLSGASAAESAGAFLQLSQALGAGALRGEEFNSVAEQAPGVLTAIARVMDEPVGALKDLAKEGRITRDIVLQALQDIEKNGAARLADVLDTQHPSWRNSTHVLMTCESSWVNSVSLPSSGWWSDSHQRLKGLRARWRRGGWVCRTSTAL